MADTSRLDYHSPPFQRAEASFDYAEALRFETSSFQRISTTGAELTVVPSVCVRLDLEDVECYEQVTTQFQQWGVTFKNAIALRPSNPAFPVRSGNRVLMGAPKSGTLEAKFDRPVRHVSGFITSSRRTIMAAFDANDKAIAQADTGGSNLAGSGSAIPPNVQVSLSAENIHRVIFHAFDGNLTLDEFSFSF